MSRQFAAVHKIKRKDRGLMRFAEVADIAGGRQGIGAHADYYVGMRIQLLWWHKTACRGAFASQCMLPAGPLNIMPPKDCLFQEPGGFCRRLLPPAYCRRFGGSILNASISFTLMKHRMPKPAIRRCGLWHTVFITEKIVANN